MAFHFTRFTGAFSRRQRSPICILSLLGEEDWSKLTRLQLENRLPS
jgi:hypothetical protein